MTRPSVDPYEDETPLVLREPGRDAAEARELIAEMDERKEMDDNGYTRIINPADADKRIARLERLIRTYLNLDELI